MRNKYNWVGILITLLFSVILFQDCVWEKSDLKITIINKSVNRLYIGNLLSNCDSCDITRDVRFQCSYKNSDPPMLRILNSNDSVQLVDKLLTNKIRVYTIQADSLDKYCTNGASTDITKETWVHFFSGDVNMQNKTCRIMVK
jgi:hypothetical protein